MPFFNGEDRGQYSVCGESAVKLLSFISFYLLLSSSISFYLQGIRNLRKLNKLTMFFYIKFIRWYYILLTILALIAPLNYPVYKFLPALIFMWLSFFLFQKGCYSGQKRRYAIIDRKLKPIKIDEVFLLYVLFLIFFIPLYIRFYTGGEVWTLITSFRSNTGAESNYHMYQDYFEENNLNVFSFDKLPYILGYGLAKLLFYYFVLFYVGFSKKIRWTTIALLVVVFVLFSLVGMSRGTSFENFESLVLLTFALLTRSRIIYGLSTFTKSQFIGLGAIAIILGCYFIFSKSLRSGGEELIHLSGPTSTLRYDADHWSMLIMPSIGRAALGFTGYFTFPLYYTSEVFWKIWFESGHAAISAIVPFTGPLLLDMPNYRIGLERVGVDCGACWNPDCTLVFFNFGVPAFLLLSYYMGVWSAKMYKKGYVSRDIGNIMLLFLIVYEMISFPVGNFLVVSSANKIVLLSVIIVVYFGLLKKYRLR